ncbi:MAG: dTDP-4-dehydrorhamnose reductase [Armatimonadetes bacterium]|nr:dTDP-4-dehydrorhamnose reductase [Armatimonadota bacterium]
MKILVTGASGMLGQDMVSALPDDEVVGVDITGDSIPLDITDLGAVRTFIARSKPDVVLHLAAFTNVDACQTEPETAWRVNAGGTWNIAAACQETDAAMLYISTDFVFDGRAAQPYDEFERANPLSVYGRTKYAGEELVRQMVRKHYIARTAWLYGPLGKSFPATILRVAREGKPLRVIGDQEGSPTYTVDLAEAVARIIRQPLYGVYHVTNSGSCSWHEFARAILLDSGLNDANLSRINSEEWPSPTKRPAYSVLEHRALRLANLPPMRPWRDALQDFLVRYAEIQK